MGGTPFNPARVVPGITLEKVQENTEFKVEAAPKVTTVDVPTAEELVTLRRDVDPGHEYLGRED